MEIVMETRRLLLREMELEDLDFVASMLAHPEVMRFYPKRYSLRQSEAWVRRQLERYCTDGFGFWLAVDRANQQPVGQVGVLNTPVDGKVEPALGYLIHHPFWRQGFAAEAASASLEWALARLDAPRVITLVRLENSSSQGVARKIGMKPVKHTPWAGYQHILFHYKRNWSERAAPRAVAFPRPRP